MIKYKKKQYSSSLFNLVRGCDPIGDKYDNTDDLTRKYYRIKF